MASEGEWGLCLLDAPDPDRLGDPLELSGAHLREGDLRPVHGELDRIGIGRDTVEGHDIIKAVMDGQETLRAIRREPLTQDVKVVVLTSIGRRNVLRWQRYVLF